MSTFEVAAWMVLLLLMAILFVNISGANFASKKMKEAGITPVRVYNGVFAFGKKDGKVWFGVRHGAEMRLFTVQRITFAPHSKKMIKVTVFGEDGGAFEFETPAQNQASIQHLQLETVA